MVRREFRAIIGALFERQQDMNKRKKHTPQTDAKELLLALWLEQRTIQNVVVGVSGGWLAALSSYGAYARQVLQELCKFGIKSRSGARFEQTFTTNVTVHFP